MGVLPQRKPAALAAKPDLAAWWARQLCSCHTFTYNVSLICASVGRFLSLSFKTVSLQSDSIEASPSDGAAANWSWWAVWATLRSWISLFYPMRNPIYTCFVNEWMKRAHLGCQPPPSAWETDPGMFHKTPFSFLSLFVPLFSNDLEAHTCSWKSL